MLEGLEQFRVPDQADHFIDVDLQVDVGSTLKAIAPFPSAQTIEEVGRRIARARSIVGLPWHL